MAYAALTTVCACAVGSVRGFDELVERRVMVVGEKRKYRSFGDKTVLWPYLQ
jgi:hypothetical protein